MQPWTWSLSCRCRVKLFQTASALLSLLVYHTSRLESALILSEISIPGRIEDFRLEPADIFAEGIFIPSRSIGKIPA